MHRKMFRKGRLIVLDGLGKSGKTTILKILENKFPEGSIIFTREPGGTPFGLEVRKILLQGHFVLSALSHLLAFFAVRRAHIEEVIMPRLESGVDVITDRFDSATDAYNLWGEDAHELRFLFDQLREHVIAKDANPYLYIILNLDPQTAFARHQATKDITEKDKFDDKPLDFFERVNRGFMEFASRHHSVVIDANRPLEVVAEDVYQNVLKALA